MSDPNRVLVLGDTHGDIQHVERAFIAAQAQNCDAIFQVGDFGYWEHADTDDFLGGCERLSQKYGITIYWLDGNHENHTWLRRRYFTDLVPRDEYGFVVIRQGVHHAPRAHRWTWHGVTFLALGGAYSIDKEGRLRREDRLRRQIEHAESQGWSLKGSMKAAAEILRAGEHWMWWPEEEISDEEALEAMQGGSVDVMFTHDKPRASNPWKNRKDYPECYPNQDRIQAVVKATTPRLLIHGHLHFRYEDTIRCGDDDRWTHVIGLDCNNRVQQQVPPKAADSWVALDVAASGAPSTRTEIVSALR